MTSKSGFALKSLLVGSVAAVALSVGVSASVSAQSDRSAQPPVAANQCSHPGYAHFGFSDKQACQNYVSAHARANAHAGVGNGYGGGNNNNHPSIIVTIGDIINSTVNITVNFVTNIFS